MRPPMRQIRRPRLDRRGATLTELMVAVVILSVGILGLFNAFRFVSRSLFVSRAQTLATNLAQERVESLKNYSYYELLITTTTGTNSNFTPSFLYDNGAYGPETIQIGGITFTRYTFVTMANVSNGIVTAVGSNYPDTGMKQMVVYVTWQDGGSWKKWSLTNLLENPAVNPLDATITGTISASAGGALPGAVVSVEQNSNWSATADGSGRYTFTVYHGTYTVRASSAGYYDAISPSVVVARGQTATVNLALPAIATGTVAGQVWYNSNLVISQVVADTNTLGGDGGFHDIEYVELFNPTTFAINIGVTGNAFPKPVSLLLYNSTGNYTYDWPTGWGHSFDMVNVTTYVAPGHYYLIANATYFAIAGGWIAADAYYDSGKSYPKYIDVNKATSIALYNWAGGGFIDYVGYNNIALNAPWCEYGCIPNLAGNNSLGTPAGQQIVRVSSPAASAADTAAYGRAYDSNNNVNDFLYPSAAFGGFVYAPHNHAAGAFTVVAGKVPSSVTISATDPNSPSATFTPATVSSGALNLSYLPFVMPGVTTGTWSAALSNGNYSQIVGGLAVAQGASIYVTSGTTTPTWPASGLPAVFLSSVPTSGFIKGHVTDPNNTPLSGISILAGGYSKVTDSSGNYFMVSSSGAVQLIANSNNANPAYIQYQAPVSVPQGGLVTQDVVLSLGTRLTGYCTTGTTPVPNVVVVALSGGNQAGSDTTNATGIFTIKNISTGTYTVQPVTEVGQGSNPTSLTVTNNSTGTVFVGTFTFTGAFGSINGSVTNNSAAVTSGALIIASTAAIASSPPAIVASSASAMSPFYMVSSKADGTYALPVRGANTYFLSAYVPVISNTGGVTVTTKTYTGIVVPVGGNTTQNIALP